MNLNIRPTEVRDAYIICNLRWDSDVVKQLNDINQYSLKECQDWLNSLEHNPKSKRYMVFNHSSSNFIGLFRVDNIDYINNHCSVGLDICSDERGKGYSKLIYKEMFDQLFNYYNMNLVWLEVLITNEVAFNLYTKLGFEVEGSQRERILRNGKYISTAIMSITRHEWINNSK